MLLRAMVALGTMGVVDAVAAPRCPETAPSTAPRPGVARQARRRCNAARAVEPELPWLQLFVRAAIGRHCDRHAADPHQPPPRRRCSVHGVVSWAGAKSGEALSCPRDERGGARTWSEGCGDPELSGRPLLVRAAAGRRHNERRAGGAPRTLFKRLGVSLDCRRGGGLLGRRRRRPPPL